MITTTTTHKTLYLFTSRGRVFGVRVLSAGAQDRQGQAHRHDSDARKGREGRRHEGQRARGAKFVFFVTKLGTAKRLLTELEGLTRAGRRVLSIADDDDIARVRVTSGSDDLLLSDAMGQTLRVNEEEFRPLGRQAQGVRGIGSTKATAWSAATWLRMGARCSS